MHWEKFDAEILAAHEAKEGPIEVNDLEVKLEYFRSHHKDSDCQDEDRDEDGQPNLAWKTARLKWEKIRDVLLPEPLDFKPITYQVGGEALSKRFKDTGLQVIVKMASIELTPEKPVFPAGGWHVSDPKQLPSRLPFGRQPSTTSHTVCLLLTWRPTPSSRSRAR